MKNEMNEIPTPETDALYNPENGWTGVVPIDHARDLERRLTIAREALDRISIWSTENSVLDIARKTLTNIALKA